LGFNIRNLTRYIFIFKQTNQAEISVCMKSLSTARTLRPQMVVNVIVMPGKYVLANRCLDVLVDRMDVPICVIIKIRSNPKVGLSQWARHCILSAELT